MNKEHRRQFIHLSGFVFIISAQVLGGLLISAYCFMIAFFFLFYSYYLRYEKRRLNAILKKLDQLETKFRDFTLGVARTDEIETKFLSGPFWFFLGFGVTFLFFPLQIASAACSIVAIGDVFSNFIGRRYGTRKITTGRTVEGTSAFIVSSFAASLLFVNPIIGIAGALSGAGAEIFRRPNDNLLIPIASGIIMIVLSNITCMGIENIIWLCGI
ncbi:MAG: hypothetical protein JW716_02690 [Candidatus Aenigmarchaeota archaeon]|nr:hypothetical protein [Candidatus Aenigmarchaeota archaeon]